MLSKYQAVVRTVLVSASFIAGLSVCVYAITLSPSYQSCIASDYKNAANKQQQSFRSNIGSLFLCETDTLNANTGALTAIGTFAIAFFTLTLWITSGAQSRELRRSVDVSTKTARDDLRAYVDVEDIYFLYEGKFREDAEDQRFTNIQRLRVKNYGKTPATDLSIWINNTSVQIPKTGFVIPYGGNNPVFTPHFLGPSRRFGTRLERETSPGLISFGHKDCFFTFGRIQYRDIYRRWWVEEFVYEHIPPRTFRPYGGYNREEYAGENDQPNP